MDLTTLLESPPIADPEEEAFVVFSQDIPSSSLGFVDAHADVLELTVAGVDLVIHQSRSLLTSDRKQGTTGAVLWSITPHLATWLASPSNPLFTSHLLTRTSTCLELGAGTSGILALTLGPRLAHTTATDQSYAMKLLRLNIASNLAAAFPAKTTGRNAKTSAKAKAKPHPQREESSERISTAVLDWEEDAVAHLNPVDLVVACDCIYNEALIEPLNTTCAAICRLKSSSSTSTSSSNPTLCLIAQQLRSPDVFEAWLKSFHRLFHVWQVPDAWLSRELSEGSGFVVHVGVVR